MLLKGWLIVRISTDRFKEILSALKVTMTLDQNGILTVRGPRYDGLDPDAALNRLQLDMDEYAYTRVGRQHLCELIEATAQKILGEK
jgi:hypothetical protein